MDWEKIMKEGQKLADQLKREKVDSNEAKKALGFYKACGYDDRKLETFLALMGKDSAARTKTTVSYYRGLKKALELWKTDLVGEERAMAGGWGLRMMNSR